MHNLPKLPYLYDALEPIIDAETMEIHHAKHHASYVEKLNSAIENTTIKNTEISEILTNLEIIPEEVKTAVINNVGGHFAHSFFWNCLSPTALEKEINEPEGKLLEKINKSFGSFEEFKNEFTKKASTLFGSGWTWAIIENDKIEIINTSGHDTPLALGKKPILVLDIWEHAYYLKHKNKRPDYIENFWKIINWDFVESQIE